MPAGLTLLALFAQAATVPAGPAAPPAPKPSAAAKVPACDARPSDPNGNQIVICAERTEGYRLNPDVLEARREMRSGGRPNRPGPDLKPYRDCTVGPMGCGPQAGINLMAAALMDGATPLRTLWSIILPMSRPILGVVSIFAVTAVWKDFLWPKLVMPHPETRTVSVGIYAFSGGTPMNVVVAASVIAAIPTVIVFLIFQRNIMSGLTTGSLKG